MKNKRIIELVVSIPNKEWSPTKLGYTCFQGYVEINLEIGQFNLLKIKRFIFDGVLVNEKVKSLNEFYIDNNKDEELKDWIINELERVKWNQ